jgi:hypothetical protein
MNSYLENDICKFKILYKFDKKIKYNILSACFYKMDKYKKNFKKYTDGLQKLIDYINSQDIYILKLFIDENIYIDKNIMNVINSCKKLHLVIFTCSSYISDKYHFDNFGSLIRYFPLFNFPNNDANNIIICDIELNEDDFNKLKTLTEYTTKKREFLYIGSGYMFNISKKLPYILGGLVGLFNYKFNHNIIIDFIKNIKDIKDKGLYEKRFTDFGFGTDEIFLNNYLIKKDNYKLLFDNNINIGIITNYNTIWFMYFQYVHTEILKLNKDSPKIFKFILGKYYIKNSTLDDMFKSIDTKINNNNITEEIIYISKRFYKIIKYFVKRNKEWMDLSIMKTINTYFKNIIKSNSYIFFNPNNLVVNYVIHNNVTKVK